MIALALLFVAASFSAAPAAAQFVSDAEATRMLADLRDSHILGNVPDEAEFAVLLDRDLVAYFASLGVPNAAVESEMLRRAPIQGGLAYPKFYLWVQIHSAGTLVHSGAICVEAVDKVRFRVSEFLSAAVIEKAPERVAATFPAALAIAIRERARVAVSGH